MKPTASVIARNVAYVFDLQESVSYSFGSLVHLYSANLVVFEEEVSRKSSVSFYSVEGAIQIVFC